MADAAIHGKITRGINMDCFVAALLAMTRLILQNLSASREEGASPTRQSIFLFMIPKIKGRIAPAFVFSAERALRSFLAAAQFLLSIAIFFASA